MSPLGVIGEDKTDCETIKVLVRRILGAAGLSSPSFREFAPSSGGCAAMRRKAPKWIRELSREGCEAIILVHDLDRNPVTEALNDEVVLRREFDRIAGAGLRHVCIPVEEIEAWFWCDQVVLDSLGRGNGKAHPNPHKISRPKEMLRRLALKGRGKAYATTESAALAEVLDLQRCTACCPAFAGLREFALNVCS